MGKKNKNGKKTDRASNHINLLTALVNLAIALILLFEKLKS